MKPATQECALLYCSIENRWVDISGRDAQGCTSKATISRHCGTSTVVKQIFVDSLVALPQLKEAPFIAACIYQDVHVWSAL